MFVDIDMVSRVCLTNANIIILHIQCNSYPVKLPAKTLFL